MTRRGGEVVPYKSDKQRKFMHVEHPKIAAKWDKEEHDKKKSRTKKKSKKKS